MTPLEALYRCQRAWEATQPQLFFELWPDEGLDETHGRSSGPDAREGHGSLRLVEPTVCPHTSPGSGLNPGAEPCRDLLGTDGESALLTAAPAHGKTEPRLWANGSAAGASAPHRNQTGPDATPAEGARPAQRRSV